MTENRPFGWLDRRRWVLEISEEAIKNAREMIKAKTGRGHDSESRLEWSKILVKLLETYDSQLSAIRRHLWGNTDKADSDEPGVSGEEGFIEFEKDFQKFLLTPWNQERLKRA